MAIKPICDKCGKQLKSYGALLFSPPTKDSQVRKFHLCRTCYKEIAAELIPKLPG